MQLSPPLGVRTWLRLLGHSIAALCGVVVQVVFLPSIAVAGIAPDVLLLLVIWIALRQGQTVGALAGFTIGLLMDLVVPGALGINAFAKTWVGFIGGMFAHPEVNNVLALPLLKLLGILALSSGVHSLLYYALLLHPLDISFGGFLLTVGIATGYTLIVGMLAALVARLWGRRGTISEQ